MNKSSAVRKQPVAYAVTEFDENTGGIIFATSSAEARRCGSAAYSDGDFASVRTRRAPEFDAFSPGPVPKLAMLEAGWWFECDGCDARLHTNTQEDFDDATAEGETPRRFAPVEDGPCLYCSDACREIHLADRAAARAAEARAIDILAAELLARVPGVTLTTSHAYAVRQGDGWATKQAVIGFRFPGGVHGDGHYRYDDIGQEPHVTICHGDRDAWTAWRRETAGGLA